MGPLSEDRGPINLATQRAVTDRLFVSIFTIRSWWRGKTGIPKQYHSKRSTEHRFPTDL